MTLKNTGKYEWFPLRVAQRNDSMFTIAPKPHCGRRRPRTEFVFYRPRGDTEDNSDIMMHISSL